MGKDPVALVRAHGILLQAARGPVPSLVELIAEEPIRGSWWAHPRSHEIYDAIERARRSPDVVAIRLLRGQLTLVHRDLWPALFRLADRVPAESLAAVHEEHTERGAHRTTDVPFPDWVPRTRAVPPPASPPPRRSTASPQESRTSCNPSLTRSPPCCACRIST